MLTVPRIFIPEVVRQMVLPGCPGAYALGHDRGSFQAGYIGRSDHCIQTRLATHNHLWKYEYFIFQYATDAENAFQLECQYWHALQGALRNLIHPAAPCFSGLRCPYCGFASAIAKLFN